MTAGRVGTLVLAAALSACSTDGTGPTAEELLGVWGAVEYVYSSQADTTAKVDLLTELGATYSLQLISGGSYETVLHLPEGTARETGTFDVRGDRLTLTPDGGAPTSYRFTFDQVFLRLTDPDAVYDVDGDGTAEPATLRLRLDRF